MFVTLLIATFLEIGALVSGARLGFRKIPGGPYAIIFSALYQYHRMIPVTYRFRIFGITFNDKIFVFIPAVQMMLSQYFSTLVPAVCGLLVGALYRSDVGNIKQWRFPRIIRSWTSRLIGSSLASGPIPRSSTTMPNETTGDTTAINNLMTSAATVLGIDDKTITIHLLVRRQRRQRIDLVWMVLENTLIHLLVDHPTLIWSHHQSNIHLFL